MEHLRILRDLELKKYHPIYFLMGEEPYFIDQITEYIENHVLDESSKAFGQTIVYGRDVTMEQIISLAKGFPMMGDKQVVIVKEAQDLKEWKSRKSEDDDQDMRLLENYLNNPTPSTILVFNFKHKTLDKRKKIYKLISKQAVLFESERIKENKLPAWITQFVQDKELVIQNPAALLLTEYLGTDLGKVVNAINKIAVLLPKQSEITTQHIADNIGINKDYNVWELQKALGKKDVLKANRIIHYFDSNPKANPTPKVNSSLYGYFGKLLAYSSLADKSSASKALGIAPYFLDEYRDTCSLYPLQKLERIIGYLHDADKKSKGIDNPSIESGDIMRELVFKILH